MFKVFKEELEIGGKKLVIETGKIARQADGAIIATLGVTSVDRIQYSIKERSDISIKHQSFWYAVGLESKALDFLRERNFLKNISSILISDEDMPTLLVEIEGGKKFAETISYLTERGINVMGHIGLLPQSIKNYKSIKIKGFNVLEKNELIEDAKALIESKVFSIVIEAVAQNAAESVLKEIKKINNNFPVIGIGASVKCSGQILVTDDILNLTNNNKRNKLPKFVKVYKSSDVELSVKQFCNEVRNGSFPNNQFCYINNKTIPNNITYLKFNKK